MTAYYLSVPSPGSIIGSITLLLILHVAGVGLRFAARMIRKQGLQTDEGCGHSASALIPLSTRDLSSRPSTPLISLSS
ncbi:hypothetical protein DM02DRAFT_341510 [Periconia macrospinosa]|uniref:Uncharacterized protein n=1 Tax=Periconia macrospinosa TaxID=97972 RepID=A0A2V1DUH8_9PLEO|nr:hypothetical protein DM02DRAFT_341510 [Periconia macrospinosa]